MMSFRIAAATVALVAAGATAAASGTTAAGGLSIAPAFVEHEAQVGPVGQIQVANGSAKAIAVTVRARPWTQARSGAVTPDGGRTLAPVRLSVGAFTLAPGERRSVSVALAARPGSGSLYGALDVLGTPQGAAPRNGITARYRLLGGLRLNPAAAQRRLAVRVGVPRADAAGAVVPVRSTGNTVEPLTGSATISAPTGTLRATIAAQRILPGGLVDLRIRRGRLPAGRYSATVTLRQDGRRVARATRAFRVL